MKIHLTLFILLFLELSVTGQNNFSSNYDRSSITTIYLNREQNKYDSKLSEAAQNATVYDKFDDHNLEIRSVYCKLPNLLTSLNLTGNNNKHSIDKSIENVLQENKIPNLMILKWWDVDENGNFSTSLIEKRGIYNATDIDFNVAGISKRGISMLKDSGEKLIENSYILTVDFHEVRTMKEVYNAQDAANKKTAEKNDEKFIPVNRTKTGYQGYALVSIFKIDWNDTLNYEIWTSPYYNSNKNQFNIDQILSKKFPLSSLARFNVQADGSQYKDPSKNPTNTLLSDDQLFVQMYNDAVTNTLIEAPKELEAFRVKTGLISRKPLKAKIGKKEGLSVDQRYFVWENKMNKKGDIIKKRKGVIRVKKISDNRQSQLGKTPTSVFYQTAGKKLYEGMLLQQNPDYGIGISAGLMNGAFGGFNLRSEINVSLYGGYASNDVPAGIYLYGFLGFETKSYASAYSYLEETDITFLRYGIGLEKEIPFARNFKFTPFAGFGMESTSSGNIEDLEYIETYILDYGVRLGLNIKYNIQLFYSINYINPISFISAKYNYNEEPELWDQADYWTQIFTGRSGQSNEISIRILF